MDVRRRGARRARGAREFALRLKVIVRVPLLFYHLTSYVFFLTSVRQCLSPCSFVEQCFNSSKCIYFSSGQTKLFS